MTRQPSTVRQKHPAAYGPLPIIVYIINEGIVHYIQQFLTCSGELIVSFTFCWDGLASSPGFLLLLRDEFLFVESMLLPWELDRISWDSREKKSAGSSSNISESSDLSGLPSLGATHHVCTMWLGIKTLTQHRQLDLRIVTLAYVEVETLLEGSIMTFLVVCSDSMKWTKSSLDMPFPPPSTSDGLYNDIKNQHSSSLPP